MSNDNANPTSSQLIAVDPKIAEIVESMRREAGNEGELTVQIKQDFGKLKTVNFTWVAQRSTEMWAMAGRMIDSVGDIGIADRHEYPKPNTIVVKWQYRFEMK